MLSMLSIVITLLFNKLKNVITLAKSRELNCFKAMVSRARGLKRAINFLKILIIKLFLNAF